MPERKTLNTCLKCGGAFYSDAEYHIHVRQCTGREAPSLQSTKPITQDQARVAGQLESAEANGKGEAELEKRMKALKAQAMQAGVKGINKFETPEALEKAIEEKKAEKTANSSKE